MTAEIDKNVSAHLPGTWGIPRSVKLERIPGQSLGISIVGELILVETLLFPEDNMLR